MGNDGRRRPAPGVLRPEEARQDLSSRLRRHGGEGEEVPEVTYGGSTELDDLVAEVQERAVHELAAGRIESFDSPVKRALQVHETVTRTFQMVGAERGLRFPEALMEQLIHRIVDEMVGLGPLEPLLCDGAITEIEVAGPDRVSIVRDGERRKCDTRFQDAKHLLTIIRRIIEPGGLILGPDQPEVSLRLPDGTFVTATLAGPMLHIRRLR